jgi:hypothetical protein
MEFSISKIFIKIICPVIVGVHVFGQNVKVEMGLYRALILSIVM